MGLFDGTIKKFASKLVERLNAYASAFEEQSRERQGTHHANNYIVVAMTLRTVGKIITEVAEAE